MGLTSSVKATTGRGWNIDFDNSNNRKLRIPLPNAVTVTSQMQVRGCIKSLCAPIQFSRVHFIASWCSLVSATPFSLAFVDRCPGTVFVRSTSVVWNYCSSIPFQSVPGTSDRPFYRPMLELNSIIVSFSRENQMCLLGHFCHRSVSVALFQPLEISTLTFCHDRFELTLWYIVLFIPR